MGHFDRLQLVGRITYYLGWIMLLCGGLVQVNFGKTLFMTMSLTKRNLFEVSVMLFIICMATQLRALALAANQVSVGKRGVAA
jgi:multidrug transporter EmrE-like cation transporter